MLGILSGTVCLPIAGVLLNLTTPTGILLSWLILTVLFTVYGLVATWLWYKDSLLILLPEGCVFGKKWKQKPALVVNFKDALVIEAKKAQLHITLPLEGGKREVKKPDLRAFATPKQVALSIADAYEAFRSEKSDLHR